MSSKLIRLEEWFIVGHGHEDHTPEFTGRAKLYGKAYGHPNHADGAVIRTSPIVKVDRHRGVMITHSGSEYLLGDASSAYEELYPNAKARVFAETIIATEVQ